MITNKMSYSLLSSTMSNMVVAHMKFILESIAKLLKLIVASSRDKLTAHTEESGSF